ncbi:MAG: hypothetical protein ACREFO_05970 [Acetobacteraceae bacterium]
MGENFRTDETANSGSPDALSKMRDACRSGVEPEEMLRQAFAIIRAEIPFDVGTYSEYHYGKYQEQVFVTSPFSLDGEQRFRWPARWVELPPGLLQHAESNSRIISNLKAHHESLQQWYKSNDESAKSQSHLVVNEYLRRDVTSLLTARRKAEDRTRASLSLGRLCDKPAFTQAHQDLLDKMHPDFLLRRVGEAFVERRQAVTREIDALLRSRGKPEALAAQAVRMLGTKFDWEYVAIFRVDRDANGFRLLAQFDRDRNLGVPDGYTQPIDDGMLGSVLREKRELYARDVTVEPKPWGYLGVSPARSVPARSAMCFPVRTGDRRDDPIRWILDLESSQFDSFPQPEQDTLREIVGKAERTLGQVSEVRLNKALIENTDRGVVVQDHAKLVRRTNRSARRVLGVRADEPWPPRDAPGSLEGFIADQNDRDRLRNIQQVGGSIAFRLKGADGVTRRAQVTLLHHDKDFGDRVWRLVDLDQLDWGEGLEFMRAAVATVTAQTHGRLLLVGSLLRHARERCRLDSETSGLLDRAARTLASADLTYERTAASYDAFKEPKRESRLGPVELGWELERFRNALPGDDQAAFDLKVPDGPVAVTGDRGRLRFALRSLLGHLLALRPPPGMLPAGKLHVGLERAGDGASLHIELTGAENAALEDALNIMPEKVMSERAPAPEARDLMRCLEAPVAYHEEPADATVALGLAAVRSVIKAHGGTLRCVSTTEGNVCLEIVGLPLWQEQPA